MLFCRFDDHRQTMGLTVIMTLVKMLVIVILLLPQYLSSTKIDYCTLNCTKFPHVVCDRRQCKIDNFCRMEEMTTDLRNWVLEVHNEFRSDLALGKNPTLKFKISNMMRINYDMELEYLAQCWANVCPEEFDKCRRSQRFTTVAQILSSHDILKLSKVQSKNEMYQFFKDFMEDHIKSIHEGNFGPNGFMYYTKNVNVPIQLVAQLMYAPTTHVGCGISMSVGYYKDMKYLHRLIVCDYANVIRYKQPLFLQGEPCSQCREPICNDGLCGEIEPTPTDDSYKRIYPPTDERLKKDSGKDNKDDEDDYSDGKKYHVPKLKLLFVCVFLSLLII